MSQMAKNRSFGVDQAEFVRYMLAELRCLPLTICVALKCVDLCYFHTDLTSTQYWRYHLESTDAHHCHVLGWSKIFHF